MKKTERARKVASIKKGRKVKAPKLWWDKMYIQIKKEYPDYSDVRIRAVIGGIWKKYPIFTKINIVNEYQNKTSMSNTGIINRMNKFIDDLI